ncbi:MAG TPA: ASCH domain-containing protein [Candidatus Absconditabacterales bacterium]|nr:ASCH domain-containing protein [Candidatus Absconditabacterales bacterium]HMT26839.1 ASCH domain-containing protein [Candidatus Absconditabacterales bacterium]
MEFQVQKRYFDLIKSGLKIYEGRLSKDKYRHLKVGDIITFKPNGSDEFVEKKVTSIHIYGSFADAGLHLGIEKIVPGTSNIGSMVETYREFYSKEDEERYNVIMIGF